jgi:hypothetical protein
MLPHPIGTKVRVFRDDPRWEGRAKAWMLPMHVMQELFVCSYDLATDEDGDYCGSWKDDSEYLEHEHPGCVFVYGSNA